MEGLRRSTRLVNSAVAAATHDAAREEDGTAHGEATRAVLRANKLCCDGGYDGGAFAEVLRFVGGSCSLLDPTGFGLDVGDCARLAIVSRECRGVVEANPCWGEALAALEADFPLVPLEGPAPDPSRLHYRYGGPSSNHWWGGAAR